MEKKASTKALKSEIFPIPALVALVILAVGLTILNPRFASVDNAKTIADQAAIPLVLAVGLTFVVLMGSIDLSLEGILAAGSMITALLVLNDSSDFHLGFWAIPITMVIGAAIGLFAGVCVTRLRVPSFLVTIGTWQIGLGIALVLFASKPPRVKDDLFRELALGQWVGFTKLTWLAITVLVLGLLLQLFTRFGRYSYVIGGGQDIARMSGIDVAFFRTMAFTLSGALAGLAGSMATARAGVGAMANSTGMLFLAIAGVVIGGTLLSGGRGGVLHSAVGILIMVSITNGMILAGVSSYMQQAAQGAIVIIAVTATLWRRRQRLRVVA